MERLIILSDLWGTQKSSWLIYYTKLLENNFEIKYYDCCELAELDLADYSEENLHSQFISFGIDKAVQNLLKKEKERISVLGFSIGGFIAWKAACEGLTVNNLTAISSTRLRYENIRPNCAIELIYGENDKFKPEINWFKKFEIQPKIYPQEGHGLYSKKEIAENLCNLMIESVI